MRTRRSAFGLKLVSGVSSSKRSSSGSDAMAQPFYPSRPIRLCPESRDRDQRRAKIRVESHRRLAMADANVTKERQSIDPGTRIGHVHLKVADLERALNFYVG